MVLSGKNALLLGLKGDSNTLFSDWILTLGETSNKKLYPMNFVIKIESLFGIEKANLTANIFKIITPGKELAFLTKRRINKRSIWINSLLNINA